MNRIAEIVVAAFLMGVPVWGSWVYWIYTGQPLGF